MGGYRFYIFDAGNREGVFVMKKKLLIVLGVLLVLGLFFTACSDDNSSENDPFKGTWLSADKSVKIVAAADKTFKVYVNNIEGIRGTYTISGNDADAKLTEVYSGIFGEGTNKWIKYSDLTSAQKSSLPINETFKLTISGNTISFMGTTFTKQND